MEPILLEACIKITKRATNSRAVFYKDLDIGDLVTLSSPLVRTRNKTRTQQASYITLECKAKGLIHRQTHTRCVRELMRFEYERYDLVSIKPIIPGWYRDPFFRLIWVTEYDGDQVIYSIPHPDGLSDEEVSACWTHGHRMMTEALRSV